MNEPTEKQLRIQILNVAAGLEPGQQLNFFRPPELTVARELVKEGLVTGSAKDSGGAGITGIRDAGRACLKAQTPMGKLKRIVKWAGIIFLTAAIAELAKVLVQKHW